MICGLGRLGLPLALEAKKRKERVVVIAKNPDGEGVAETIRNRIKVVFGEAGEAETLQQANAGTARSVFAVCPDDQTNIAIAAQIGNLDVKPRSTSRPECWMYISKSETPVSAGATQLFAASRYTMQRKCARPGDKRSERQACFFAASPWTICPFLQGPAGAPD